MRGKKYEKIPSHCQRESYIKNYANKGKTLLAEDIELLKNCTQCFLECKGYFGTFEAMYVMSKKKGCLGYYLQVQNDIESNVKYFDFYSKKTKIKRNVYARLGFTYNFTIISLQDGESSNLKAKAPSSCELQVLERIAKRLSKENEFFKGCPVQNYPSRKVTAEKICNMHPEDALKRVVMT
ncbi:uncharacterized protein LOC130654841 [Hydractinia symbiolongicarpus]|uniref:uncharacterized protein LOC130654841 n=1 Tax=Hydractinia symbiolongicarpus TaxID=13093 RepID=UPI00254D88EB|nr:uncharacterized protein LOC130654841 [Hydractinia symbiolongicarpus]XP_057313465.1 uncharacterized protein LOC130654841 [Hydractinia symbiolongicarpus]